MKQWIKAHIKIKKLDTWMDKGIYVQNQHGKYEKHRIYNHTFTQWVMDACLPFLFWSLTCLTVGFSLSGTIIARLLSHRTVKSIAPIIDLQDLPWMTTNAGSLQHTLNQIALMTALIGLEILSMLSMYYISKLSTTPGHLRILRECQEFCVNE